MSVIFSLSAAAASAAKADRLGGPGALTLTAVGDILLHHWPIEKRIYEELRKDGGEAAEYAWPFAKVKPHFEGVVFGNLEGPFCDCEPETFADKDEIHYFAMPTRYVEALKLGGFNAISLANNHIRDAGDQGVLKTLEVLKKAGIKTAGAGREPNEALQPIFFDQGGVKLGLLAFVEVKPKSVWARPGHPGAAHAEPLAMAALVRNLKRTVDHVAVSLHWGVEYTKDWKVLPPSEDRQKLARSLIDAGASVVLGHHSHAVERMEAYHGGIIFYGLGNFVFAGSLHDGHPHSVIAKVFFNKKKIKGADLVPVRISPKDTKYRPEPVTGSARIELLERWTCL